MNAREYAIQANGSFALPDACFKIKSLMEDEHSSIEQFANVISIDPSMTSRLLQIANSPIYSFSGEISTISRAITVIGAESIYNMMLIDSTASAFAHFSNQSIDLKRFWRMSVVCALATKNLAIKVGIQDIERLFIAGLLQNFGELIVAKVNPELAINCESFWSQQSPLAEQKNIMGFTYTDISAELLSIWQLPEKIIMPIRESFKVKAKVEDINKDAGVMSLASCLAVEDSFPDLLLTDKKQQASRCASLGITADDLALAKVFANQDAESILKIMNADFYS
jgi:HD-like signal output (HDOD) protein